MFLEQIQHTRVWKNDSLKAFPAELTGLTFAFAVSAKYFNFYAGTNKQTNKQKTIS